MDVEPLVLCAICHEDKALKQPRSLSCLHSFCEACLQRHMRENGGGASINCHICQQPTYLPPGGVGALEIDLYAKLMQEKRAALTQPNSCQACPIERVPRKATHRCAVCTRRLCAECKRFHNSQPGYEDHYVHSITEECLHHGMTLDYICQSCVRGLCLDCVLTGEHQEHLVEKRSDSIEKTRGTILTEKEELEGAIADLDSFIAEIKENHKKFLEDGTRSLHEAGDKLKLKVDMLIAAIIKRHQERHDRKLNLEHHRIKQVLQRVNQTLTALEAFLESKSLEFVLRLPEMKKKLEGAVEETKTTSALYKQNPLLSEYICEVSEYPLLGKTANQIQFECHVGKELKYPDLCSKLLTKLLELKTFGDFVLKQPREVAVFSDGSVFVADLELPFLPRFDKNGMLIGKHFFDGATLGISSVCVERDVIYVAPSKGGNVIAMFPNHITQNVSALRRMNVLSMTANSKNLLLVVENLPGKVLRYSLEEKVYYHQEVQFQSTGFVKAIFAAGIDFFVFLDDRSGRVFIRDAFSNPYSEFEAGKEPRGVVQLQNGNILIADRAKNHVTEFDLHGRKIRRHLSENDGIRSPCSLAYCHPYLWVTQCKSCYHGNTTENCVKLFCYK